MGQYQRILAAIDQSALSEQVFATALGLAKSHKGRTCIWPIASPCRCPPI
jgi:hypothetical protein